MKTQYRKPARVLTQRDPILFAKLSIREFLQWLFFGVLFYLTYNQLLGGLDFFLKLGVVGFMAMIAFAFIHAPVNGLAGIEWLYINLRYRLDGDKHHTLAPSEMEMEIEKVELP
jgi:hypothetical protein